MCSFLIGPNPSHTQTQTHTHIERWRQPTERLLPLLLCNYFLFQIVTTEPHRVQEGDAQHGSMHFNVLNVYLHLNCLCACLFVLFSTKESSGIPPSAEKKMIWKRLHTNSFSISSPSITSLILYCSRVAAGVMSLHMLWIWNRLAGMPTLTSGCCNSHCHHVLYAQFQSPGLISASCASHTAKHSPLDV